MRQTLRRFVVSGVLVGLCLLALAMLAGSGQAARAGRAVEGVKRVSAGTHPKMVGHGVTRAATNTSHKPASPREVLYDQYDNPDPFESGTASQVFGAPWSDFDSQAADD